jgi:uncharacterized protein with FMN-binding domain
MSPTPLTVPSPPDAELSASTPSTAGPRLVRVEQTYASFGGRRLTGMLAVASLTAAVVAAPVLPASATANPGQALNNDYGQSQAEVNAEMATQIASNKSLATARNSYNVAHKVAVVRRTAEAKARAAYLAAVKSKNPSRIARAKKVWLGAHAVTVKATAVETAARKKYAALTASVTASVKAAHYHPRDGVFTGRLVKYLVPTVPFSFEPMQVSVTVYGGHVSNVSVVAQAPADSDSGTYNTRSLSKLCLYAMNANDTASIANVSGASLSSEAFQQSLQSALTSAGFKV